MERKIIEEAIKKFELKEKRKKEMFSNTDYIEKVLDILKRKDFICDEPRFEEEMSDLNGDELINISIYKMHNPNTDYHNTDKYYYGCSISDDAKRHNNYYEFKLEDVIKFHTDNIDKAKVLQK